MLVALTGASGFIGSYTVRALRREGHDVRALVRDTSRRDHIAADVAEFVEGDVADESIMPRFCDGADAVVHDAVDWSAVRDDGGAFEHFDKNVAGTLKLLETARRQKVGQFLFVSSVAVNHEIVTSPTITETHRTWPNSAAAAPASWTTPATAGRPTPTTSPRPSPSSTATATRRLCGAGGMGCGSTSRSC